MSCLSLHAAHHSGAIFTMVKVTFKHPAVLTSMGLDAR